LLPVESFSAPPGSRFDHCALDVDHLTVHLAITTPNATCPICGSDARRVHSRYPRRLADLPCLGRAVRLQVTVRRFSCLQPECPRRIFAERLPGFAEPHARTTARLCQAHESIGYALGGEAGARLTARVSMTTGPDTLLRRVKRLKGDSAPPPRFVGIDDWAWCKGQRDGTIVVDVVDLERGDVVDLLPDRDAETVKKWLSEHPGVELVSRDRWPDYIQAAAEASPNARQVADRWHLLKNVREALERHFERE
jgi:transposase